MVEGRGQVVSAFQGNSAALPQGLVVELKDVDRDFFIEKDSAVGAASIKNCLHALSRVSLRLKEGEFVFLTGPSGSGKTTLIRLVLGLDQPTSGEVHTLGKPVFRMSETERRKLRQQVGIVFQDHRLVPSLNVFENIELPLHFMEMSKRDRQKRVLEILETVQMRDYSFQSVQSLSAGEKQRVSIARALVTCPRLIIADEPTGNLDPVSARSLVKMLRELKGHGTTVLIATHDMSLVRDFGGRVLELVGGSLPVTEPNKMNRAYKVPKFWMAGTT